VLSHKETPLKLTDFIEVLLAIFTIGGMVVVGRSNIRKQLITDLQSLVLAHEQTINKQKDEIVQVKAAWAADSTIKDERIRVLEETVNGYAELVRQGYLSGFGGPIRGNGPVTP